MDLVSIIGFCGLDNKLDTSQKAIKIAVKANEKMQDLIQQLRESCDRFDEESDGDAIAANISEILELCKTIRGRKNRCDRNDTSIDDIRETIKVCKINFA